jgi:hypothetical protein
MDWKRIALATAVIAGLATLPFHSADAYWRHRGPFFWPFWAGAAVVGTAAAVATAPLRAIAPPYYYGQPAPYYYAPPAYYAPGYYPYYYR